MKLVHIMNPWLLGLLIAFVFGSCAKENEEFIFVHDSNLITQMIGKASHSGGEFRGEIYEFNKAGEMMEAGFKQEDVEGGYGLILFPISATLQDDVDLSKIYLRATVTYDEIITPSLSGRHDISGDGMIITVTSGERTKRQYRVRGYFE
ncbi:hypothetical protein [Sphingobacterium sp. SYP-B4668]|uniref:hypothetical protein n=1 Tax=Sphingobacterium sp. SYP-B4668 TaxID=2996035 RepID=UPI0005326330|nr:hypothetical protein [Sphingobacterium sp. SYP-B4668]